MAEEKVDLSVEEHENAEEIVELDRAGNIQRRWLQTNNQLIPIIQDGKIPSLFSRSLTEWHKAFSTAFLPIGYPHSVSKDYLAYQTYDSLQAFFSTITSLLANRALLAGLGVGDAESSATYAMLLTILKDAMSRVATILFAHRFGLRIEPDAKTYRFLADLFNDTAFFLELYSPYLGQWGKITALCTGEALRALCGVAGGASKAALSIHFAKHDNLAELNAKEASQETAVGLMGLLAGTLVVKWVEDHRMVVYLMIVLVFAHLLMNYLGVRAVCMNTLNRQRATILFDAWYYEGKVFTPGEVAQREGVLFHAQTRPRDGEGKSPAKVVFSFADKWRIPLLDPKRLIPSVPTLRPIVDETVKLGDKGAVWFLGVKPSLFFPSLIRGEITLSEGVLPRDVIQVWFGAHNAVYSGVTDSKDGAESIVDFEEFMEKLEEAGWNLDTQLLETAAPMRIRRVPAGKKGQ